jgi:hypothetical protein
MKRRAAGVTVRVTIQGVMDPHNLGVETVLPTAGGGTKSEQLGTDMSANP